ELLGVQPIHHPRFRVEHQVWPCPAHAQAVRHFQLDRPRKSITVDRQHFGFKLAVQRLDSTTHVAILAHAQHHTAAFWCAFSHQKAATTPSERGSVPPYNTPVNGSRWIICPRPNVPRPRPDTGRTLCPISAIRAIVCTGMPSSSSTSPSGLPSATYQR